MSSSNEVASERKMVVYVPVTTTVDGVDGPSYCRYNVTDAFVTRMNELRSICQAHGLSEVRVWMEPDRWGSGDVDVADAASMDAAELVVSDDQFWFAATFRHFAGDVETETMHCDTLLDAFMSGRAEFSDWLDEDLVEEVEKDQARERGEHVGDDD